MLNILFIFCSQIQTLELMHLQLEKYFSNLEAYIQKTIGIGSALEPCLGLLFFLTFCSLLHWLIWIVSYILLILKVSNQINFSPLVNHFNVEPKSQLLEIQKRLLRMEVTRRIKVHPLDNVSFKVLYLYIFTLFLCIPCASHCRVI